MLTFKSRRILIATVLAAAVLPISAPEATAADTVLLETGLEWCQGCYDGWTVSSGATQWIAFVVTASGAATISKVELNMNNTNATSLAGSTVEFYGNPTVAPKNSADLLGTLTFSEFRIQTSAITNNFWCCSIHWISFSASRR
jgi:hypothetical protein